MRQIARDQHHGYRAICKALESAEHQPYTLAEPKLAPKLGPYKDKINELLAEEAQLPRKQRYTTHKIYELMQAEGYSGSESNLRRYVGKRRRKMRHPATFIPLSYEPGKDAQVDWGEAKVIMAGEQETVQLFVMRLCYSRRIFVMAFPRQKQEAFFTGHAEAFRFFEGIPETITYDNLKTAVKRVLKGRSREEQERFITLRSHYLFASRFCNTGQGHEKGGVEHGVKYTRQNYLVPLPKVRDYAELNAWLRKKCLADDARQVDRQPQPIGVMWTEEQKLLRSLPATDFPCYSSREVTMNRYGQVVFETNRYSVPAHKAQKQLTLRAYPFRIEILNGREIIAAHQRCYGRQEDILNPLHYLPLLAKRPGAFEHAKPLRQWRESWPPLYDELLHQLKRQQSEIKAVREFVKILQLHNEFEAEMVQTAITQAVSEGIPHLNGVLFCLNRLLDPTPGKMSLSQTLQPQLDSIGQTALSISQYDRLLRKVTS